MEELFSRQICPICGQKTKEPDVAKDVDTVIKLVPGKCTNPNCPSNNTLKYPNEPEKENE